MSFSANVLKVMIASPGDVPTERAIATEELYRWNNANAVARQMMLQPVKWETHSSPQMGAHPQAIINQNLLIDADIVVGIFGTRIGTATEDHISGSVEEIKKHVAAGKLAMLYFSRVPVDVGKVDLIQYKALQAFKEECRQLGLYSEFETHEQFRAEFGHHLDIELNKPQYRWLSVNHSPPQDAFPIVLSDDAKRLLVTTSDDRNGSILTITTMEGYSLQTNGETFTDGSNRSAARWKKVLRELLERGLLEENGEGLYDLTDEGYTKADLIVNDEKAKRSASDLSDIALQLLQAASQRGEITVLRGADRDIINAGNKSFPEHHTPRESALWNAGLEELIVRGFVTQRSRAQYQLTDAGYKYLDSVASESVTNPRICEAINR